MTGSSVYKILYQERVGLAVAIALIRSVARHESITVGNFWSDLGKSVFCVLLPL